MATWAVKINLPEDVNYILDKIKGAGYKAYIVGGCVRDSIMGITPHDWDIATDAYPQVIKSLFEKTVDTGIKHGSITIMNGKRTYEVTTFRVDGEYEDNRHPSNIRFTPSLEDDLSRRDFTINAMAYGHEEGCIDPFNGIPDIKSKLIRTVGDPNARFREDALRMLRAVRFSAQLDFNIDEATMQSIRVNSHLIQNISMERIRDELTKILLSEYPGKFLLLHDLELLKYIIPELATHFTVILPLLETFLPNVERDKTLRWAALLFHMPKVKTRDVKNQFAENQFAEKEIEGHFSKHAKESEETIRVILKRLRFDNNFLKKVCQLVKYSGLTINSDSRSVRKAIAMMGEDVFDGILKIKEAENRSLTDPVCKAEGQILLDEIRRIYGEIKSKGHCLSLKELAITGDDLVDIGFKPGKEVGNILKKLLDVVLDDPDMNNRDRLIKLVKQEYKYDMHG